MVFSVVIPTRNRASVLTGTLDSLGWQTSADLEVVVVCDGEDTQTRALSEAYSAPYPLRWIFTPDNRGQGSARNTGALAAKGEIVLFLDDDTAATHELVSRHREHHERRTTEDALIVYGSLIYIDMCQPRSRTEQLMRRYRDMTESKVEACLTSPGFDSIDLDHRFRGIGVNCSISREIFLAHGGFSPALRSRGEDFELGSRLYNAGARFIFEPRAIAYHRETKELSELFRYTCELTGYVDVYRALRMGQRNAQTRGLTAVRHQSPLRTLKLRWYWNRPESVRWVARIAREVTDATGSRFSFKVWRRAELAAGYWQGVKSEGLTLGALRQFVGEPLPVLAFPSMFSPHVQADKKYTPSPQRFLRVMRTLRKLKFHSVSPEEGTSSGLVGRNFLLTFDGDEDFYSEVFPHLCSFALKPVVFLAADRLGQWDSENEQTESLARKWLSAEQVRELHQHGVQFGSSGLTRAWLPDLSDFDLRREVVDSKARLEDLLGSEVTCFAYPGGGVDQRVRAAIARAGYEFGFTAREGLNFWEDPLCLRRMTVTKDDTMVGLALRLVTGRSFQEALVEPLGRILGVPERSLARHRTKIAQDTSAESAAPH